MSADRNPDEMTLLTRNAELDLLPDCQGPEELARLEGIGFITVLAQAGGGDVSKRKCPLGRRVVRAGEHEGVSAQHRLDVGKERHGGVKRRVVGEKEGDTGFWNRLYQHPLAQLHMRSFSVSCFELVIKQPLKARMCE